MDKQIVALRYWCLGRGWLTASKALEFAKSFHTGTRKDGVTPEFSHQVYIASLVRTFYNHLMHPEETLAATFLHDVCEDYDVSFDEIENLFGPMVREAVNRLTKKFRSDTISPERYYKDMRNDPIASIVKGCDRIHNIQTMQSAFDRDKQERYITETETLVLPMLKEARHKFPQQEPAYENTKLILKNQIQLIKAIHEATRCMS
jgi:(p)ppGpp synthase/HD superfamily hydrolase